MGISWQRGLLFAAVMLVAAVYDGLAFRTLRDLYRRPVDRQLNGTGWALAVIRLPIVGAMLYGYRGTTLPARHGATSVEPDFTPFYHLFDDDEIWRKSIL